MTRVLFLATGNDAGQDAAWAWLSQQPEFDAHCVDATAMHQSCDVLWLHAERALPDPGIATLTQARAVLLTGAAAMFGAPRPHTVRERTWSNADDELFFHDTFTESPRIRGHAGMRAHPLFDNLHNGVFTWWPTENEPFVTVTLDRTALHTAQAIAVERAYIHVNADIVTAWSRRDTTLPLLCIGAYLPFAAIDPFFARHVRRFAVNALLHAAGGCVAPEQTCWRTPPATPRRDDSLPIPAPGGDRPGAISFAGAPLRLAGSNTDAPFTLAGRRALVAGTEHDGVAELWVHPLRALRTLRLAGAHALSTEVTALGVERGLRVGDVTVAERVTVPHELGAMVVEWEPSSAAVFELCWSMDLRLMWPYPAGALGELRWHDSQRTLLVHAGPGPESACCHFSLPVDEWRIEPTSAVQLDVRATVRVAAGEVLRLVVAATASGPDDLDATLVALRDPISIVRARTASLRRMQRDAFAFESPEPVLDAAVEWAKYRLDSYLVTTPGVGRSLVAGYWHSTPGWGDGRPGYAWYFGRDAVWTAFASLAVGDFDTSRDVIRFLGELQDLTGKVLHECTTSGLVHYDAADATPLYLLLVARHHAWTGEISFLNGEWDHVQRALRFCIGTDTDGDELIENPRVGHGWIEFGRLGGGKVTYYNAGIWVAALRELATAAEDIGDRALALELHSRAKRARLSLEARFFDPHQRRYALKAWQDADDWQADYTPTATHAVPLLLGVADPDRAASWLDEVAAPAFNAPWGVRMIPDTHELFNPRSYHGGAVWPLYTGWTAWAEYVAGRTDSGYRHLLANARLHQERAAGAWDEVLHGTEPRAVGVCPDQAWSTALTIAPLVCGMLGAEPDAPRNRLRLRPQLPATWDRAVARCIRLADSTITLRYERHHEHHHVFRLEQERGATPVRVILEPVLNARALRSATVDGMPAQLQPAPFAGRMMVPVQIVLDAERVVELHTE